MSSSRISTSLVLGCRRSPLRVAYLSLSPHSPRRFVARSIATVAADTALPPRPSFLRRAASFTGRAFLFTLLGFVMAAAPAYEAANGLLTPVTDEDTLNLYIPEDAESQAIEDHIQSHPLVKELRTRPGFIESRPHLKIPPSYRAHNLTGSTLMGPGRMPVPPLAFYEEGGKSSVQIFYVGEDLCGHPGIIHGGFLATILDEGLASCCFAALPSKVGMTANLNINYRAPAYANTHLVLRGTTTKVEGRKAWVEGRIETLVGEGETPTVIAEATALFISPKQAAAMSMGKFYAAR